MTGHHAARSECLSPAQAPRRIGACPSGLWAILAASSLGLPAHAAVPAGAGSEHLAEAIHAQAPNISADAISTAIDAYWHARQEHLTDKPLVTIVDYSLPSDMKRLAVVDVETRKVLFYTYVAHGKGSGLKYASYFSNSPGTDASSLGVYLTGQTYYGGHGLSLRLRGLEPRFNGAAYRREIVIHSAWYVSRTFAQDHGRMGRSWGCFAVSRKVESAIVQLIRGSTVLVGYYPDRKWLRSSVFLGASG
ncbi:MAG: murein L,D-transpeptidase catalytic domain family protein [Steroidobacteraceae bacterium]